MYTDLKLITFTSMVIILISCILLKINMQRQY